MSRPVLLDLFCGAGGAAMGYQRAGFDVIGCDIKAQPHYPFMLYQRDVFALDLPYLIRRFDVAAIHASPPCQAFTKAPHGSQDSAWMVSATRAMLSKTGLPWIIENVPNAPMRADFILCGCFVGLRRLRRLRWFETSWEGVQRKHNHHDEGVAISVFGNGESNGKFRQTQAMRREAMGVDWMNRDELAQAIPPAYTEYMGAELKKVIGLTQQQQAILATENRRIKSERKIKQEAGRL